MSTIGKALVVAQVAFSILLMAFAAGVTSIQTNWRDQTTKLKGEMVKRDGELGDLRKELETTKTTTNAKTKELEEAAKKSQGEADAMAARLKQADAQLNSTKTQLENQTALAAITAQEARARRDEAVSLRTMNSELHVNRDKLITQTQQQSDKIFNLDREQKAMADKQAKTNNDIALLQKFIRMKGFEGDPSEVAGMVDPPPTVQALVLDVKKGGRNGSDLIEISVGSDQGLAKGNEMIVYRADGKARYLGKIRLDYVDYRSAVGVLLPESKNGDIQRGDNVTTRL